jgi:hypothetical protein
MISRSTALACYAGAVCLTLLAYASFSIGHRATTRTTTTTSNTLSRIDEDEEQKNNDKFKLLLQSINATSNCTTITTTKTTTTTTTTTTSSKKPIWVPSFPGSGAELFRELVTAITSQPTVDGALIGRCLGGGDYDYITCKTHWPTLNSTRRFQDPYHPSSSSSSRRRRRRRHPFRGYNQNNHEYDPRTMVLIRNPMHAIPSWYNQIYETHVRVGYHIQQAPLKNWKRYIVSSSHSGGGGGGGLGKVREQLQLWKDLIFYWLDHDYYRVQLWIPYEQLIDPTSGPKLLTQVGTILLEQPQQPQQDDHDHDDDDDDDHTTTTTTTNIECLWNFCVRERKGMKRAPHKYRPPFLREHRRLFLDTIQDVIDMVVQHRTTTTTTTTNTHHQNTTTTTQNNNEYTTTPKRQQTDDDALPLLLSALEGYQREIETNFVVFDDDDEDDKNDNNK